MFRCLVSLCLALLICHQSDSSGHKSPATRLQVIKRVITRQLAVSWPLFSFSKYNRVIHPPASLCQQVLLPPPPNNLWCGLTDSPNKQPQVLSQYPFLPKHIFSSFISTVCKGKTLDFLFVSCQRHSLKHRGSAPQNTKELAGENCCLTTDKIRLKAQYFFFGITFCHGVQSKLSPALEN